MKSLCLTRVYSIFSSSLQKLQRLEKTAEDFSVPYTVIVKLNDWEQNTNSIIIECKDFRTVIFSFSRLEDMKAARKAIQKHAFTSVTKDLFAFQYTGQILDIKTELAGWPIYNIENEFKRQHVTYTFYSMENNRAGQESSSIASANDWSTADSEGNNNNFNNNTSSNTTSSPSSLSTSDNSNSDSTTQNNNTGGNTANNNSNSSGSVKTTKGSRTTPRAQNTSVPHLGPAWVLVDNAGYRLVPSYPNKFVLPAVQSTLRHDMEAYFKRRIPVMTWKHPHMDKCYLFRCGCHHPGHHRRNARDFGAKREDTFLKLLLGALSVNSVLYSPFISYM